MKLTLASKNLPPIIGVVPRIGAKDLVVINSETGEELSEKTGLLWGDRELALQLLTEEHLGNDPEDASYVILVLRCDSAVNI